MEAYYNEVHNWTDEELKAKKANKEDFWFLRNYHSKSRKHLQNSRGNNLTKFSVEAAVHFGIDPTRYSNHS